MRILYGSGFLYTPQLNVEAVTHQMGLGDCMGGFGRVHFYDADN